LTSPDPQPDFNIPLSRSDSRRQYLRNIEKYATVRCLEADQIIGYLRTGKEYRVEARLGSSESNDLFQGMSAEIGRLTRERDELQARVQKMCRLTERYAREHAARKAKRKEETDALTTKANQAERDYSQLCRLIVQLFPTFVPDMAEPMNVQQLRHILVNVAHKLKA
jgi:hypothetical protein